MPTEAPTEDRWLTRREVAERFQVAEKTVAMWASRGEGPRYRRIGNAARYRLSDLVAWENTQVAGGAA
jgi:predicted DNA-binding transcriptional regulator AlpA